RSPSLRRAPRPRRTPAAWLTRRSAPGAPSRWLFPRAARRRRADRASARSALRHELEVLAVAVVVVVLYDEDALREPRAQWGGRHVEPVGVLATFDPARRCHRERADESVVALAPLEPRSCRFPGRRPRASRYLAAPRRSPGPRGQQSRRRGRRRRRRAFASCRRPAPRRTSRSRAPPRRCRSGRARRRRRTPRRRRRRPSRGPAAPPARQTWAPDLTMIDRHYGHLARDGREHAIRLLDALADSHNGAPVDVRGRSVDIADPLVPRTTTADWQAEQETSRSCSRATSRRRGDATAKRR